MNPHPQGRACRSLYSKRLGMSKPYSGLRAGRVSYRNSDSMPSSGAGHREESITGELHGGTLGHLWRPGWLSAEEPRCPGTEASGEGTVEEPVEEEVGYAGGEEGVLGILGPDLPGHFTAPGVNFTQPDPFA